MTPRRGTMLFIQTVVPDYRVPLVETLADRLGPDLAVLTGDSDYPPTIRTVPLLPPGVERIENRFLLGRRLLWQHVPWRRVMRARTVMTDLNPRNLSTWAVLVLRRLAGRRVVLWGHAWPRAGRGSRTDILRGLQRRLASALVLYTESQREQVRAVMPAGAELYSAPNALYREARMQPATPDGIPPSSFLYVARMVPEKKPRLLVEAFAAAAANGLDPDCRLVIVGDGPERAGLIDLARERGIDDRVEFPGHVQPDALLPYYQRAIASVSPGYVGLSMTQSLGFGVPMIYGRDEPHSPEIEAARDGFNAAPFPSDDVEGLARTLSAFARDRDAWVARRDEIAHWTAERYSLEAMCDRLITAAYGEPAAATRSAKSS